MRLLSFSYDGRSALGAIIDGGVLDVSARLGTDFVSLREVVAQQRLDTIRKAIAVADPDYSLDEIRFLPPIVDTQTTREYQNIRVYLCVPGIPW